MKENMIVVNCKVPSKAYQLLSMLRQDHDNESFTVAQAPVVNKDAGRLSLAGGFISGGATEDRGETCGLIGKIRKQKKPSDKKHWPVLRCVERIDDLTDRRDSLAF